MVDWTSKYAPNGHIITLLHRKKNQGLHRCEDFSTYNNNTKPLASLDNPIEIIYPQITQIIKGLFLHPVWRYMKIDQWGKGKAMWLCLFSYIPFFPRILLLLALLQYHFPKKWYRRAHRPCAGPTGTWVMGPTAMKILTWWFLSGQDVMCLPAVADTTRLWL